ncbi:MAG: hypothetical protein KC549_05220 [Myxococcales bacterium]|nr:hypothetical protein [Myxococcales bacterium]
MRALLLLGAGLLLLTGCNPDEVKQVTELYHPELTGPLLDAKVLEMTRVMPFYVTATGLAVLLMVVAVLNALEHARQLGGSESIRLGAYTLLLCFVSLFIAMSAERAWLPAGHAVAAFLATLGVSAVATVLAARARPERAVLSVGYVAVTLALPLLGVLLNAEIHLVDTTASLFIGFACGLLVTIVLSGPVRSGLVDFLRRRGA